VDKLIGQRLVEQLLPQRNTMLIMLVSGRVSFEIVQKAVMAGISILVSVGAPSELAIKAAQRFELTLIGFAKTDSFNLYHGDWRIKS
jgi:FdhD protein